MFPRLHLPRHAFHVLGFFILTGSLFGAAKEATLFTSQVEPGAQASTLLHAATEALKADIKDPKQPLPQETLDAFIDVARLQVVLGDFDAAKATLAALPSTSANALVASSIDEGHSARDWILFFIAKDRLKNGDAIGAAREAARMAPDLHPDREPRMDGYVPNAHAIIREALKR
jgi:hypothetical protein